MKRFTVILATLLAVGLFSGIALAQDAVPFRGTVDLPTAMAGKDTVVYRPMGLGGIRSDVVELKEMVGNVQDDVSYLRGQERDRESAPTMPVAAQQVHPFWWVLLGIVIGLVLGLLIGRGTHEPCPGARIEGPLVQGPLVTMPDSKSEPKPLVDKGGVKSKDEGFLVAGMLRPGQKLVAELTAPPEASKPADPAPDKSIDPPPATPPGDRTISAVPPTPPATDPQGV